MQTARLSRAHQVTAPDGSEVRELVATGRASMVHCTLRPGATSLAVAHRTVEEVWFFVSGRGQVWRRTGEQESVVDVEPGIGLSVGTGTHFQFRNTGEEDLCFVITTMPPWPGADEAYPVGGRWAA
jgi:mannose-6-phosphate isomerase-like protein (cupin superfamily)